MNGYKMLAVRYLKQNKRRSMITIAGATLAVVLLYALLNVGWSYLLNYRQQLREKQDYEIVFFTETEEQIMSMLDDAQITSGYVGPYYWYHQGEGIMYENALYVNTQNPYRINKICQQLSVEYGIDGEINDELAWTYLQGSEGSLMAVIIYLALLVSFIFAILGVGLIRNSIQLCMLENIKDYGNLRCIGSSKKQLKVVIYLQGLILEGIGIICGTIIGTILSLIAGTVINHMLGISMTAGFHLLPLLLVLVVFFGDLYFAMNENSKLVTRMTPVSAIRGEYRTRKERIKSHSHNVFRKLFGVDGDYAYKSLMRNRERFLRTVGALVLGIAAFICIAGLVHSVKVIQKQKIESYKYYQLYFQNNFSAGQSIAEVESSLPDIEFLEQISNSSEITEAKRLYSATTYVASPEELMSHYTSDYLENSEEGRKRESEYQQFQEEECNLAQLNIVSAVECYGYDETMMERYQPAVLDGSLSLSTHGIILINQAGLMDNGYFNANYEVNEFVLSDYKVGDTIELVNMAELNRRVQEKINEIADIYQSKLDACQDASEEESVEEWYGQQKTAIIIDCKKELIQEGDIITYTIEGIVSQDVNLYRSEYMETQAMRILMSQEDFYELTGLDEAQPTGMLYHFDKIPKTNRLFNLIYANLLSDTGEETDSAARFYVEFLIDAYMLGMTQKGLLFAGGFAAFIVLTVILNIINTTASNLHLRRKEFAQLRVIGVSKRRLVRMVLLEGIITAITADFLGILLGTLFGLGIYAVFMVMYDVNYYFPWGVAVIAIIGSLLVLCGSIYIPLNHLSLNMAEDLKTGGD